MQRHSQPTRRRIKTIWIIICIILVIIFQLQQKLLHQNALQYIENINNDIDHHDKPLLLLATTTETAMKSSSTTTATMIMKRRSNNQTRTSSNPQKSTLPPYYYLKQQLEPLIDESNFVELDHCNLTFINWTEFKNWAIPILIYGKNRKNKENQQQHLVVSSSVSAASSSIINQTTTLLSLLSNIQKEWLLELLEIYTTNKGLCDFERYRFKIKIKKTMNNNNTIISSLHQAGKQLQQQQSDILYYHQDHIHDRYYARIAFVIVAFKDEIHLQRLIESIWMEQHIIVIHLDDSVDPIFENHVHRIVDSYNNSKNNNVVVIKFGTVVYKTESVSLINLQIMDWLINDLQLTYDYHVTLGGAVYPLYNATQLASKLKDSNTTTKNVWLGEMTHKGQRVHQIDQWGVLWQNRLLSSTTSTKETMKVGILFDEPPIYIRNAMQHKSTSGNQAIYSQKVVKQLLKNAQVKELFVRAKYGCCCCLEERTWIGAMDILGYVKEAKANQAMFQLWGGATEHSSRCEGSMKNSIIDENPNRCYRNENPNDASLYFYGNETWNKIRKAKEIDGVLFARKFDSNHNGSMELLQKIRNNW